MKKTKTILTACLLVATTLNAQNYEWAKSFGGTYEDKAQFMSVDASGNVYTAGYFYYTVDFDPGAGTANLTSAGARDIFVQKMDAEGNFLWAKSFGGTSYDEGSSISTDASGNVYTAGLFQETGDFDPGAGTANLTSAGGIDIFVQKMDAEGNFLWAKSFGGTDHDSCYFIKVDASGNVYTTGTFYGTIDFDAGAGTANLTTAGARDIFVQKMDAEGNFLWAKSFGGTSYDEGSSISTDASGNVYTAGSFEATGDFDPGAATANLTSAGSKDIFVQKMDASGNFLWAKSFGGTYEDHGNSISVDGSGNVYTTGGFVGTVDFDPGAGTANLTSVWGYDIFVQKMDAEGNFLWAKSFGGQWGDEGLSICVDASENVYTTGFFQVTVDFDPGAGTANLTADDDDIFVQKMDASGNFLWAKSFGGTFDDHGNSISVDGSGNVYTSGSFEATGDFDPGAGTANLTSVGNDDVFVQKMGQTSTGVDMLVNSVKVVAYPHPTTGTVHVTFDQAVNKVELVLTDLQGRELYRQNYGTLTNVDIELPNPTGIYLLTVKTPEGQRTMKLGKE